MTSIRQIKDPEKAKELVLHKPFWDQIGRGANVDEYLRTLRCALIFSHDDKATSVVFVKGCEAVEWHCYVYPEYRHESVELCERFLLYLKGKGVKEVQTVIPSRFKATQNFALKRLFFTRNKDKFTRLL